MSRILINNNKQLINQYRLLFYDTFERMLAQNSDDPKQQRVLTYYKSSLNSLEKYQNMISLVENILS